MGSSGSKAFLESERRRKIEEKAKKMRVNEIDRTAYQKNPREHHRVWMKRSKQTKFLQNNKNRNDIMWERELNSFYEEIYGHTHLLIKR